MKLYKRVSVLQRKVASQKQSGSFMAAEKNALSIFGGASSQDSYHKVFGMSFGSDGQYWTILNNSVTFGANGYVQGPKPVIVSDICVHGTGFLLTVQAPTTVAIEVEQSQFNWAVLLIPSGYNVAEVLQNLNPPMFTPSLLAAADRIVEQVVGGGFNLGADFMELAELEQPSAKRKKLDEEEEEESTTKRLKPTPGPDTPDIELAQAVVAELVLPRMTVLASGSGVCAFPTGGPTNAKIKAYNSQRIHTKVDDQIVFMAKAGHKQVVNIHATLTYKIKV